MKVPKFINQNKLPNFFISDNLKSWLEFSSMFEAILFYLSYV